MKFEDRVKYLTFANPRTFAEFKNWPAADQRTVCTFAVLRESGGSAVEPMERAARWTAGNAVRVGPLWHDWVRIVDGSDGKTYIAAVYLNNGRNADNKATVTIYGPSLKPTDRAKFKSGGPLYDQVLQLASVVLKGLL